jgi:hypothetical protein
MWTPRTKARGKDGKTFVGIMIDQGLFGEPITAPHVRMNAVNVPVCKVTDRPAFGPIS